MTTHTPRYSILWIFNIFLSLVISFLYLRTPHLMPQGAGPSFFYLIYFWGHFALLLGLIILPFAFLANHLSIKKIIISLTVVILTFLQTLLMIDTFVYQQYRFHINLFVLELFFKGEGQVISFPWFLWALVILFFAIVLFFQILILSKSSKALHFKLLKIKKIHLGFFIFAVLVSHVVHLFAHAKRDSQLTQIGFLPPFAAPLKDDQLVKKWGFEVNESEKINLGTMAGKNSLLNYPLKEIQCQPTIEKLNVLLIVLDSTRFDQLNPEVMPFTHQLKMQSTEYLNHYSGSNSTRGGIFSLFYGLPPLYFEKFREIQKGPVLIEQFIKNNYQMGLFSSAPLTMPEFNQTVFADIQDLRLKSKADNVLDRDLEITNLWIDFVNNRKKDQPFFGFLFYDTPHEYAVHPDYKKFQPSLDDINYFKLNNKTDPTGFINRHKNSVYYVDHLLGQVFQNLQKNQLLKNTVVIFTSDHGQEFNDNKLNFWGHNSNFTSAQTQVPFFIHWPGQSQKSVKHWTSHYDVAPTILKQVMNCKNPGSDFSSGEDLTSHQGHQWMIHGTYGDFAIRLKDHFVLVKLSGNYETLDLNYRPLSNSELDQTHYRKALDEMRRFYK